MAEVDYIPDEFGWFKLSRRMIGSSRWVRGSPETVKLMVYMLERASSPQNPYPGDVIEVGETLATHTCLPREGVDRALSELLSDDLDSFGTKASGAFLEPLTNDGKVVGYRIVNFSRYNPGLIEGSAVRRKQSRERKARKAALKRWGKSICAYPRCGGVAEVKVGGTGLYYCLTHGLKGKTAILPAPDGLAPEI